MSAKPPRHRPLPSSLAPLALALSALTLAAPAGAGAAPLTMAFTEARANVGVQLSDAALMAPPASAPFAAQLEPGGQLAAGALSVPDFRTHITEPIEADVTVAFRIGAIDGSFDPASGALTLQGEAAGTLSSEGRECAVSTEPAILTLTSAADDGGAAPRPGVPFTDGLAGAGAIAGRWSDMHATAIGGDTGFCSSVEGRIEGPGGIWLAQADTTAPAPPSLTATDPASPGPVGTLRILGTAEPGSTVRLYAGPVCAGAPLVSAPAAALASPGIALTVPAAGTQTFSATATDPAANTSACSAPISYTSLAPAAPAAPAPPPPACRVPRLRGEGLAQARAALRAAACRLGKVRRLHRRKARGRPAVVIGSSPRAGSMPADGTVDLRLAPARRPRRGR